MTISIKRIMLPFFIIMLAAPLFSEKNDTVIGIVGYCPCEDCCKDNVDRSTYKDGDIVAPPIIPIGTAIYANGVLIGTVTRHYQSNTKYTTLKRFFKTHSSAKAFGAKIIAI